MLSVIHVLKMLGSKMGRNKWLFANGTDPLILLAKKKPLLNEDMLPWGTFDVFRLDVIGVPSLTELVGKIQSNVDEKHAHILYKYCTETDSVFQSRVDEVIASSDNTILVIASPSRTTLSEDNISDERLDRTPVEDIFNRGNRAVVSVNPSTLPEPVDQLPAIYRAHLINPENLESTCLFILTNIFGICTSKPCSQKKKNNANLKSRNKCEQIKIMLPSTKRRKKTLQQGCVPYKNGTMSSQ